MSNTLDLLVCQKCRYGHNRTSSTVTCDIVERQVYGSPPISCVHLNKHSRLFNDKPGKLNKSICRKCIEASFKRKWNGLRHWNNSDEKRWKEGSVSCPTFTYNHGGFDFTAIDRYPPEWCLYKTEQVVCQRNKPSFEEGLSLKEKFLWFIGFKR